MNSLTKFLENRGAIGQRVAMRTEWQSLLRTRFERAVSRVVYDPEQASFADRSLVSSEFQRALEGRPLTPRILSRHLRGEVVGTNKTSIDVEFDFPSAREVRRFLKRDFPFELQLGQTVIADCTLRVVQRDESFLEPVENKEKTTESRENAPTAYDVFLCYNREDRLEVERIDEQLRRAGILTWRDESDLRPGRRWRPELERMIKNKNLKSVAVFVGKRGVGPWQNLEIDGFLTEIIKRKLIVIPVLLTSTPKEPRLPVFLNGLTWVDFRKNELDPLARLIWGITGKRKIVSQDAVLSANCM